MSKLDEEIEKKEILRRYRGLLRTANKSITRSDKKSIRKAFDIALEAHKDMRRKSGEPYIYHPIAVARIVAEEMGLDTTSIVCALLHDTVEDTYITLEDIENTFDLKTKEIIDGLTKISGVFDHKTSAQAENFRKMLLTLSDDVRVILIKLADRLHNMRTLGSMTREKQLKIAGETMYMYAPLAHRLGLYNVKTELEDLSLKYKEPDIYQDIAGKLKSTKSARSRFINRFILPIKESLEEEGFKFEIKGRPKSIFSIWNKINTKNVSFEEIYDVFAVRIILDKTPVSKEKSEIWRAYSIVTDFYQPNPDRLRDWISLPKANGYESLHTTVMSSVGQWVEVQIRSRRMDEVAEKGFAAHWKYKDDEASNNLDIWLSQIREVLENDDENSLDFIDNFKLNLYSEEIFVFTPKGDLITLPKGATALDFAFHIHSQVGSKCIGTKVNKKLVPLSHELNSGDQIEVLTSKSQSPKEDWLSFVKTARARQRIKTSLKEERKKIAADGKEILRRKFKSIGAEFLSVNITALENHYNQESATDLYFNIANKSIDLKKLKNYEVSGGRITFVKAPVSSPSNKVKSEKDAPLKDQIPGKKDVLLIGDDQQKVDYELASCCHPVEGDDVFGFVTSSGVIKIHRNSCTNADELMSSYNYRIMKAIWASKKRNKFVSKLKFTGIDDIGLVFNLTKAISEDLHVNMKSISFDSNDGIFDGSVTVLIEDVQHLEQLMDTLREVQGVLTVDRLKEGF